MVSGDSYWDRAFFEGERQAMEWSRADRRRAVYEAVEGYQVRLSQLRKAASDVLYAAPMGHTMLADLEEWQERLRALQAVLKEEEAHNDGQA